QTRPVKILQFGKGNFLRAFADWMIDIANEKTDFNGAIQIVQTNSRDLDQRFHDQEGLYHVVINGIQHGQLLTETRLITCVADLINPYGDYHTFLRAGENPDLQFIISNTTEAGIKFDPGDSHPEIPAESFPGKLTSLLYHRYKFFSGDRKKGLTILPCELIEKNGESLREIILQYIALWRLEEGFKGWVYEHNLFCNTLVDRIVPGFPKENISKIWDSTGFEDHLVVTAEPFHLFLIEPVGNQEKAFGKLRSTLPLEQAGLNVKFVNDIAPYRISKVRILNGAHTAMVPVGYLRGLRTVQEVIEDPFTGDFIHEVIGEEILPTLDLPPEELRKFAADVMERFRNPFIRHELKSIALNSISKFQVRVLPTILEYIRQNNKLPKRLLYSFAALILFYKGEWRGETIQLNDTPEVLGFFKKAWNHADISTVVSQVLSHQAFWQTDLTKIDGLTEVVERHLNEITQIERHDKR
ncbi:MAG TPA: tagaturonate reductase, partial [Chryseosolibacter sp.]